MRELPRLREIQNEVGPLESSEPALFLFLPRLIEVLAGNRRPAQNHRDRFLSVDRRLIGERMRQGVVLILQHQRSFAGFLLSNERRHAAHERRSRQQKKEFFSHGKSSYTSAVPPCQVARSGGL